MMLSVKTYFLAILVMLSSSCAEAQTPVDYHCNLGSLTLAGCLLDYLGENHSDSATALYVVDLRGNEEVSLAASMDSLPSSGIYRFGLMGPHDDVFLFVKDGTSLRVLDDYAVSSVLNTVSRFFERSNLIENEKVECLANVVAYLRIKQLRRQPAEKDDLDLN